MKRIAFLSIIALSAFGMSVQADQIKGEASCAKCELKVADSCQNVITVTGADGKKEQIFCEKNPVAKAFHPTICKGPTNVTAEGAITEKDGKKYITLTKIEEAK